MNGARCSVIYMTTALMLLTVATALAAIATGRDARSPLAWSLWVWVGVAVLHVLRPLPMQEMSGTTVLILCVGLVGLTLPVLQGRTELDAPIPDQGHRGVSFARFVMVSAVILTMVVVGALAFRSGIASAVGTDFSDLSLQQVRAAQNGEARGGGFLALLSAANPIAACLGIYGAMRYSRTWIVLTLVAVAASTQNPARTSSISLLVAIVIFWLYARNAISRDDRKPSPRRLPLGRLVLAGIGGVAVFLFVGELLQKNYVDGMYATTLPGWAVSPVLYFSGGVSALAVALNEMIIPIEFGSSVFVLMRAASFISPDVVVPDTIGLWVSIPMPFNVYTGFGQMYFDFGILGVFGLSLLLGWLALVSHRKADTGRMEWAWVSALMATLLFSLPLGFRLFNLDVALQLTLGFLSFRMIRLAAKGRRTVFATPQTNRARAESVTPDM